MPGSAAALQPQAALEQACVNALVEAFPAYYRSATCRRLFDGEPPPSMGLYFVSVWSPGGRDSNSQASMDEMFSMSVTVTVKFVKPFDQWVMHRDQLELHCTRIRALLHGDCYNNAIIRAANTLAGFDDFADSEPTFHVGFRECLTYSRLEDVKLQGPSWFKSNVDQPDVGASQTVKFGKVRRVQNLEFME
jgi:hypothetical protein